MRLQDLRVTDLMSTAVLSVKESELLPAADETMKMADVRHLPVVDRHAHVVGVLSNRDVMAALGAHGRKPKRVAEVMTRKVLTIHPNKLAREAAALMLQYKIGSLPVVDDEQQLVGVITETDLLRVAHLALEHGPDWQEAWR